MDENLFGRQNQEVTFAIVDLETTGLDPTTDRVIDIAIITADSDLNITNTYEFLVNPARPVSAQHIHGITDEDVRHQPHFRELLPQLITILRGRAIVAHNASFDTGFLNAEFTRQGYEFEIPLSATVCTLDQSRIYLPDGRHSLHACLERAGISLEPRHRALQDATCCLELFRSYVEAELAGRRVCHEATNRQGDIVLPRIWQSAISVAKQLTWPTVSET